MRPRQQVIAAALLAGALQAPLVAHADTNHDWTWMSSGVTASGTFDVLNGFIQSATGTISGGGLGTTGTLSLITDNSPGVISKPDPANPAPGSFVYQNGNGDNLEGDTVFSATSPYVDEFGPALAISGTGLGTGHNGMANYTLNLWWDGSNWIQNLGGDGGTPGQIDANGVAGTLTVNPVPLPAAVWLLLSGMGGLGLFGRRRQIA